jgi:phage terminase small subunit
MAKLPAKRAAFVREYLKDFNGTQAAIRAGYAAGESAKVTASRLLADANVQAAIAKGQQRLAESDEVTIDRIVREYAAIAFARITDFVDFSDAGVKLKASNTLSPKQLAAILEVRQNTLRDGSQTVSFKLHSKNDALEALGRHLGMFGDSLKVQKAIEEMLENVKSRMPQEAYEQLVNAIGAAMGLTDVAPGGAGTTAAGEAAAPDTRH